MDDGGRCGPLRLILYVLQISKVSFADTVTPGTHQRRHDRTKGENMSMKRGHVACSRTRCRSKLEGVETRSPTQVPAGEQGLADAGDIPHGGDG